MSTFLRGLTAGGATTPLARYTAFNGAFYLVLGAVLYARAVLSSPEDAPGGVAIAVIGWFYVMGARTNAESFALATVANRLIVPLLLAPLVLLGADPASVLPLAVIDPLLALGALWVWRRQP